MIKQVYEIDENGYVIEIYVKEFDEQGNIKEELAGNIIIKDITQGLYRAKWDGEKWVEDMTQTEIDEINNQPKEPTENEQLRADVDYIAIMMGVEL